MSIFKKLFGGRAADKNTAPTCPIVTDKSHPCVLDEHMMISQYAAYYIYQQSEPHKNHYLMRLKNLEFTRDEAQRLLDFECDVLRRFHKQYLLSPDFTKMWLFGMSQPFFKEYPNTKDSILKEHFFTISEICKIVDEAEWHYWNSHERELSDDVWEEICDWHLKGSGGQFAIEYFESVAAKTGISEMKLAEYTSCEGAHLSKYKWH